MEEEKFMSLMRRAFDEYLIPALRKSYDEDLRSLLHTVFNQELQKFPGIKQTENFEKSKFLPLKEAARALGYKPRQLYTTINEGLLRVGIEVQDRRTPSSELARYYFDIEACKKRLSTPPEKRN